MIHESSIIWDHNLDNTKNCKSTTFSLLCSYVDKWSHLEMPTTPLYAKKTPDVFFVWEISDVVLVYKVQPGYIVFVWVLVLKEHSSLVWPKAISAFRVIPISVFTTSKISKWKMKKMRYIYIRVTYNIIYSKENRSCFLSTKFLNKT